MRWIEVDVADLSATERTVLVMRAFAPKANGPGNVEIRDTMQNLLDIKVPRKEIRRARWSLIHRFGLKPGF